MHCTLSDLGEIQSLPEGEASNSFVGVLRRGMLSLYKATQVAKIRIDLELYSTFSLMKPKPFTFDLSVSFGTLVITVLKRNKREVFVKLNFVL